MVKQPAWVADARRRFNFRGFWLDNENHLMLWDVPNGTIIATLGNKEAKMPLWFGTLDQLKVGVAQVARERMN